MKRIILAALILTGCSDVQLQSAAARHRAYVCAHTITVTAAANAAIAGAPNIKDAGLREAAMAAARAELVIVAGCVS